MQRIGKGRYVYSPSDHSLHGVVTSNDRVCHASDTKSHFNSDRATFYVHGCAYSRGHVYALTDPKPHFNT
jgi:hypothetical protein